MTGRRVLINGAGGGSGSFAIQLAKRLGAHVTGVDNDSKLDFMQSVGADRDRLSPRRLHPDLPAVRPDPGPGRAPVRVCLPACAGTRRHVSMRGWVSIHAAARAYRRPTGRAAHRRAIRDPCRQGGPAHFEPLAALCITGDVGIHRTFALDEVPAALAQVGEGRAPAKWLSSSPDAL